MSSVLWNDVMNRIRPILIAALSLAGLAVSSYLLTVHWGWWTAVCLGVGNCELVNTSRFSEFRGIPVALFGMGAYVAMFAASVALWRDLYPEWARRGLFAVAAIGGLDQGCARGRAGPGHHLHRRRPLGKGCRVPKLG